jgi:outer membrane protein
VTVLQGRHGKVSRFRPGLRDKGSSPAVALIATLVAVVMATSGAQADDDRAIAVVDVQKVVNESIIGKAARSNLEREMQKAKVKLSTLQADFEKQKSDLEKQSAVLSGAALEERREGLAKKQRDVQRTYQDMQEQLARLNDKEIKTVVDEVNTVVKELAKDRSYEFVFERDRQAVVYAAPKLDITDEVIAKLDKKKVDL